MGPCIGAAALVLLVVAGLGIRRGIRSWRRDRARNAGADADRAQLDARTAVLEQERKRREQEQAAARKAEADAAGAARGGLGGVLRRIKARGAGTPPDAGAGPGA